MDEPKRPGMLQIMRMATSPGFKKSIEATQVQLKHGHDMLAQLNPEHEKIHASAVQFVSDSNPKLGKDMPEMAEAAVVGLCMYRMIGYAYVQKFGLPAYQECAKKYPGLE